MTGACSDALRMSLGAYALGTLEPADRDAVETHLAGCPECLAELAELAAVVPALASLSGDDVAPPQPSDALFTRIVATIDAAESVEVDATDRPHAPVVSMASRRARPRRWLLAVAASIVLLAGAGIAVGVEQSSRPASTVASASANGVSLRVTATDAGPGTRLELVAKGLPQREHCRLVATAKDGSTHPAGSWVATYDGAAAVSESTDVARSQLSSLTLYGTDGQKLVVVNT